MEKIKAALAANEQAAQSRAGRGFAAKNRANSLLVRAVPRAPLDLAGLNAQARKEVSQEPKVAPPSVSVTEAKPETDEDAAMAEVLPEAVTVEDDSESEEDSDLEITTIKTREEVLKEKLTVSTVPIPIAFY